MSSPTASDPHHSASGPNGAGDPSFARLARLAARLTGAPAALVFVAHGNELNLESSAGLALPWDQSVDAAWVHPFVRHVSTTREPLLVGSTRDHPLGVPGAASHPWIAALLAIPFHAADEHTVGVFVVLDNEPREWTGDDLSTLGDLAASASTEMQLRQSEQRFRQLADNVHEAFWVLAADLSQTFYLNPAVERLWGRPLELFYRQPQALLECIHPEDRAAVERAIVDSVATGERLQVVFRVVHPDGATRWMRAHGSVVAGPQGGSVRVVGITQDITEQKEGADELRRARDLSESLINANTDGILAVDRELRYIIWNPAMEAITGLSREAVQGCPAPEVFPSMSDSAWLDHMHAALRGESVRIVEQEYRDPDTGREIYFDANYLPLRGASGAVEGAVVIIHDVTERKRAEAEIYRAKEEAEAANRAKSEFLSRMSHELRTPLNAILGFGQILELDVEEAEDRESVEQILRAGRHLLALIDEVLDLAKIEAGRMSLSIEPVSVAEVVGTSLELMRPLAEQHSLTLGAAPSVDDLYVRADLQRLNQVLLNLLSNAIKYNRQGGSVHVSVDQGSEGRVRLAVTDTGWGIGPEHLDALFMPFSRIPTERQEDIPGTGLGLALSKGLVEAMGGEIGVESTAGQGSTFWVELPCDRSPGRTVLPEPEAKPGPKAPAQQTRLLLYIEDNLSNLRLVERILAREVDIRMLPAMQGGLGLELAREHRPDLILLDLDLPDMHGEEVFARLRRDPVLSAVPVVIISADATPAQIERLYQAGAHAYLTKPLNVRRFLQTVRQLLPEE